VICGVQGIPVLVRCKIKSKNFEYFCPHSSIMYLFLDVFITRDDVFITTHRVFFTIFLFFFCRIDLLMSAEDVVVKSTVTVRLIRSFEHRNIKHVVLRDVDLTWKSSRFMEFVNSCKFVCISRKCYLQCVAH